MAAKTVTVADCIKELDQYNHEFFKIVLSIVSNGKYFEFKIISQGDENLIDRDPVTVPVDFLNKENLPIFIKNIVETLGKRAGSFEKK